MPMVSNEPLTRAALALLASAACRALDYGPAAHMYGGDVSGCEWRKVAAVGKLLTLASLALLPQLHGPHACSALGVTR